jgi:LPS sulfotransferase NodH
VDEDKQPQRFMILTSARTGSNLLLSLLSGHPSIKMYGELFNLDKLRRDELVQTLDDPIEYLRKRVYKAHPVGTTAVGFKMFYEHLTPDYFSKPIDPAETSERLKEQFVQLSTFLQTNYDRTMLSGRFSATWDFLTSDRPLAIIHLKRRNMLNTLISLKTAYVTDAWWRLNGIKHAGITRTTLRLDPQECERYFRKLDECMEKADRMFEDHRKLEIVYEDLLEKREEELRRVLAFLNVQHRLLSTRLEKQILAPVSELVENYGQLRQYFQQTKWNLFFQ